MPTFSAILSPERFATYRQWATNDDTLAARLYTYNVQLSAALYGPLHMLEVALRNACDQALTAAFGPDWLDLPAVLASAYQRDCVTKARDTLRREKKAGTHGQIVAELNFGFWSSLFGKESHHLWGVLRPIFNAKGVQRHMVAGQLRELRILRNRMAHYEPILALPLDVRYTSIVTLTGWLSPSAAAWIARYSAWPTLYAGPILLPDARGVLRLSPAIIPSLPA